MIDQRQLVTLALAFHLPAPRLEYREQDSGVYHPEDLLITLPIDVGPFGRPFRSHETRLVHEFAHYLAHMRHGTPQGHNEMFCFALWDAAAAWYGDPLLYPWDTDFEHVNAWANEKRTTSPPVRRTGVNGDAQPS